MNSWFYNTMRRTAPTDAAEDMDKLREDAASLLLRAAEDGTLEAVLSSRVKVQKVRGFGWRSKCVGIHMGWGKKGSLYFHNKCMLGV